MAHPGLPADAGATGLTNRRNSDNMAALSSFETI